MDGQRNCSGLLWNGQTERQSEILGNLLVVMNDWVSILSLSVQRRTV